MNILIVEDEALLADSIRVLLESRGYETEICHDGDSGLAYARLGIYDLLILDVMLPGMDGFTLARTLRREHSTLPVLMLTARGRVEDRVAGLNAGADYYLPKPFDIRELLACVQALLRRQGDQTEQLGNTVLDLSTASLAVGTEQLRLSGKEFEIFRLLLAGGKANVSKQTLLTKVWGYDTRAVENNVEVYVGFLRKKLRAIGSNVRIAAIRNLGYHLEVEEDD